MPVVDIQWVGPLPAGPDALVAVLADAIGDALRLPPGRVWVRLHRVAHYAENGGALAGAPPVFVTLLHARPPVGEALAAEVASVTAAVAAATGRPQERVHLDYAPAGAGRMAFGGRLIP